MKLMKTAIIGFTLTLCSVANAAVMYVANNATENVYTVDVDTVSGSLLGNAGVDFNYGGLGFANDGTLYGFSTSGSSLYTVDTGNGAWNLVGSSGTAAGDSFDIDPTTNMAYLTSFSGLHTIDLNTGATTSTLAAAPFFPASAFSETGIYYTLVSGILSTLDVTTGISTNIGNVGVTEGLTNLSYNPDDGFLYSVGLSSARLWQINTSDATSSDLGVIAGLELGGQYTMSTFQVSALDVPEPSTLALIMLGLMGLAGRRVLKN